MVEIHDQGPTHLQRKRSLRFHFTTITTADLLGSYMKLL